MADFSRSPRESEQHSPNDAACAGYVASRRWPEGFRAPWCVEVASWRLGSRMVLAEADENIIPICTKDDPPAGGQHRSHDSKLLVAGAAGIKSGKKQKLRRVRHAAFASLLGIATAAEPVPGNMLRLAGADG